MKLHLPTFGLKLLFALVTLAAIGFARFAYLEQQRQQIVRDIEAAGGSVVSEPPLGLGLLRGTSVTSVRMPYESTAGFDLDRLKLLPNATGLELDDCNFKDNNGGTLIGGRMSVPLDQCEQLSINCILRTLTPIQPPP